jgi:hypothetical protein
MHDHEERDRDPTCPAWCRRAHDDRLHPDDQHHHSAVRRVGVVTGHPAVESDDLAVACAVVARLVRRTDSALTWVELVSEEGRAVRLVVTLESALQVRAVLAELLAAAQR